MELKFKSQENVVSYENGTLILRAGTKLGEVLEFLPHGRIDKRVTGIGATYLELISKRNSIIVEPTKAIASTKAREHGACYFGSPTKFFKGGKSERSLKQYLTSNNKKYKKIITVADSLPDLLNLIKADYKDYFLMIDEIDTFQLDSTFRESLERCIDYYVIFPAEKRCVISATLLRFTSPILRSEPFTIIEYDKMPVRKISLLPVEDVIGKAITVIESLYDDINIEHIVVAYNSINGIGEIISKLRNGIEAKTAVYCGEGSKNDSKIKEYYKIFDGALHSKLTFITSAFFTGIDISEKYVSVIISDIKKPHAVLSPIKIKQIAGRCRSYLTGDIIIYSYNTKLSNKNKSSRIELLESADRIRKSMECFRIHYQDMPLLMNQLEEAREAMVNALNYKEFKLARKNIKGRWTISYFNVDAAYYNDLVRNRYYSSKYGLIEYFNSEGHEAHIGNETIIHYPEHYSEEYIDFVSSQEDEIHRLEELILSRLPLIGNSQQNQPNDEQVTDNVELAVFHEVIARLKALKNQTEVTNYLYSLTGREREVVERYLKISKVLSHDDTIKELEKLYEQNEKDNRRYSSFERSLNYFAMDDDNDYKIFIRHEFKVGKCYNNEQISEKLIKVHGKIVGFPTITSRNFAVNIFKEYFDCTEVKGPHRINNLRTYRINGENPRGFIRRIP